MGCGHAGASPEHDLQAVFDSAPENAVIHLASGEYRQKTVIRTHGLTLVGEGADQTRIVYDDYAKKLDSHGVEYNTFRTYTMAVCADGITMRDLSIINDALHPEIRGQEVALSVVGDSFHMENSVLTSTQDTLFLGPLPPDLIERYDGFLTDELRRSGRMKQTFVGCRIEGTVDFIFDCGDTLFDHCEIRSLHDARGIGYVAAPAHEESQTEGVLFRSCNLTCENGVQSGSIYLARPWRDYDYIAACGHDYDDQQCLHGHYRHRHCDPGRSQDTPESRGGTSCRENTVKIENHI